MAISHSERNLIACGHDDQKVRIFDARDYQNLSASFIAHTDEIKNIKFWNSNYLLTAGMNGSLRLWDVRNLAKCACTHDQHVHQVKNADSISKIAILSDNISCTSGYDGKLNFFELKFLPFG